MRLAQLPVYVNFETGSDFCFLLSKFDEAKVPQIVGGDLSVLDGGLLGGVA